MKNKRIHQSSGVTIIEVLFSIVIIITGMLGVAGLIMVAGAQMTQGLEADAMSNAGLNAIAAFETREMQNLDNMLWYNPNTKTFISVPSDNIRGRSFCIDPYFIAQQSLDKNFEHISYFPSNNPKYPMFRVTLSNMARPLSREMQLPLSREIFIAKDDLAFSTPASGTELPEQQWIREGLNGPKLKRANRAEYSWLATLTPARTAAPLGKTDHYLISVVVFKNRRVRGKIPPGNFIEPEERFFTIKFLNDGFGGGEVQLSHTHQDGVYPRHGDWIMLSAKLPGIEAFHSWYRITYIEEETRLPDDTNPNHYRHATLQGPDWSYLGASVQVTHIPSVIGVFEKMTRLGSTSLY